MIKETKRGMKSEVLSMRMDPRTRFLVDFVARVRGQSITTVVERAIQEAADNISLPGDSDAKWDRFWHVSEGIRSLKVISEKRLFPNFEEECIVSFSKIHWPFFYRDAKRDSYAEWLIDIVWPRINEFVEIWEKTKSVDYWAAGKAMQQAIGNAGIKAPDWPPKPPEKHTGNLMPKGQPAEIIDDDIPF